MKLVDKVGIWAMGFAFGGFLALTMAMWGEMTIGYRIVMVGFVTLMGVAPLLPKPKSRQLKSKIAQS